MSLLQAKLHSRLKTVIEKTADKTIRMFFRAYNEDVHSEFREDSLHSRLHAPGDHEIHSLVVKPARRNAQLVRRRVNPAGMQNAFCCRIDAKNDD